MSISPTISAYARNYMLFSFGDWTTDFATIMANKKNGLLRNLEGENLWAKTQDVWSKSKVAYQDAQILSQTRNGILEGDSLRKYATNMMKTWGEEIANGAKLAKEAGNSKLWGGAKGLFKGFGRRMPLVGAVLTLVMSAPNVWNAFTSPKGGIGTGLVETGKTGLKLGAYAGGAAVGATIGTMLFPGVGTGVGAVIGFVCSAVGGWLAGLAADQVLGKSFTEKQEEEAATAGGQPETGVQPTQAPAVQGQLPQAQSAAFAYNQSGFNPFATPGSSMKDDFMAGQIDWAKEVQTAEALSTKKA